MEIHNGIRNIMLGCALAICFLVASPTPVLASPWESTVASIVATRVPPNKAPALTRVILHCIAKESRGNPRARNGQHLGLLQFNKRWGTKAQRLDPIWSINRIVRVYEKQGFSGIDKHWCRWHRCGHYARRFASVDNGRLYSMAQQGEGGSGTPATIPWIPSRIVLNEFRQRS